MLDVNSYHRALPPRVFVASIVFAVLAAACDKAPAPSEPQTLQGSAAAFEKSTTAQALRDAAALSGRYFGVAVQAEHLKGGGLKSAIVAQASAITAEYEMQWSVVEPTPGARDFVRADAIVDQAVRNRLRMRGHALVWHGDASEWLESTLTSANADSLLEARIQALVPRYAGRVQSWDVVNEAIEPFDGLPNGFRNTLWYRALGPDYVARAFQLARQADPAAQLVYNEYNLEAATPAHSARRAAVLALLGDLRQRGIPIDALGIQAHLDPTLPYEPDTLRQFLDSVSALGLTVVVTEMDVSDRALPALVALRDSAIAATYARVVPTFVNHPAVEGVIAWGFNDANSWLQRQRPRLDGLPQRPLLFDDDLRKKSAWTAVFQAFGAAPPR